MFWAQFWHPSTGYVADTIPPRFEASAVRPIEACGSDGVLKIGARMTRSVRRIVTDICRRRGFTGYSVLAGESLLTARVIEGYREV